MDYRTTPTGEKGTYKHPYWGEGRRWGPANDFPTTVEYEIHQPAQMAFGDWSGIAIGGQYYLFGDYAAPHEEGKKPEMSIGLLTSPSLGEAFEFYGHVGSGHPDPDIFFAEGRFYLITQKANHFVSDGPWVERVIMRVGVDETGNGEVDTWTDWQELKEEYDYIEGFTKQIALKPASMSLEDLPAGLGFAFEIQIEDLDEGQREKSARNSDPLASVPKIDSLKLEFQ